MIATLVLDTGIVRRIDVWVLAGIRNDIDIEIGVGIVIDVDADMEIGIGIEESILIVNYRYW